jgi:hypothetical protein
MEKTKQKNGRSTTQEIVDDVAGDREKPSVTSPHHRCQSVWEFLG